MDYKNIIVLTVGALVSVLILSAMIPAFVSTQNNVGEEVTFNNASTYYELAEYKNAVIVCDPTTKETTINGVVIPHDKPYWSNCLVSSSVLMGVPSSSDTVNTAQITTPDGLSYGVTDVTGIITITFENGNVTIESAIQGTKYTGTYDRLYAYSTDATESTYTNIGSTNPNVVAYVNDISDMWYSGYYSTGDNDTWYIISDGSVSVTEDYTCSMTYNYDKVDGTTDVYKINGLVVNVGEESFTPWVVLVPIEVIGHESSGAMYEIYGLLPLIAGIGVLLGVCIEVFRRYY